MYIFRNIQVKKLASKNENYFFIELTDLGAILVSLLQKVPSTYIYHLLKSDPSISHVTATERLPYMFWFFQSILEEEAYPSSWPACQMLSHRTILKVIRLNKLYLFFRVLIDFKGTWTGRRIAHRAFKK